MIDKDKIFNQDISKYIFYETESGIVLNGDCLEIMPLIKEKSIDLVLTDPPYLIEKGAGWFNKNRKYIKEINNKKLNMSFNFNLLEILKGKQIKINCYFFLLKNQLLNYLNFIDKNKYNFMLLTWHKKNPTPLANNKYLADTEFIIFYREKNVFLNTNYKTGHSYFITNCQNNNGINHPTVKPLEIINNLILNSSNEKNIVLDCFSGSGTTGVACENLNRKWICIEKEKEYCEITKQRILALPKHQFAGELF